MLHTCYGHGLTWFIEKLLHALQELKDLKYPIVDQLEGLKDAPMERSLAVKEEMLIEEAIAANVIRAERKEVSGLAILLADAATQTETFEDDASPRFLRSKPLPPMYNLDWP
nr:hypothetical protein [Tanacetum cinerariifolium]